MMFKQNDVVIDDDNDMYKVINVCDSGITYRVIHQNSDDPPVFILPKYWHGGQNYVTSLEYAEKNFKVLPKEVLDIMGFDADKGFNHDAWE